MKLSLRIFRSWSYHWGYSEDEGGVCLCCADLECCQGCQRTNPLCLNFSFYLKNLIMTWKVMQKIMYWSPIIGRLFYLRLFCPIVIHHVTIHVWLQKTSHYIFCQMHHLFHHTFSGHRRFYFGKSWNYRGSMLTRTLRTVSCNKIGFFSIWVNCQNLPIFMIMRWDNSKTHRFGRKPWQKKIWSIELRMF